MLAIHVGPSLISWALINSNHELLNWDYEGWNCQNAKHKSYTVIKLVNIDIVKLKVCIEWLP